MSSSTNSQICILGFGIAGQLAVLELLKAGVPASKLTVLDETFLGGDLKTEYAPVLSNTPWWKTKKALEVYTPISLKAIQSGNAEFTDDQCMPVSKIAELCRQSAETVIRAETIQRSTTRVLSATPTESGWTLQHTFGTHTCQLLFACQGGLPKQLPLDLPTIPLPIALDAQRLATIVGPEDIVVLFGLSHSGTLICKALHDLKVPTIGIYNTPTPFSFERDGAYGGIKEGSAHIADAVNRGEYTNLTLIQYQDALQVHKALTRATKLITATGFTARPIQGLPRTYSPDTASLEGVSRAYGFGIAYPGTSEHEGKVYADVSVLSFQAQLQRCLPTILETHKDILSQE